jgi:hypothetical protein
VSERIEVRMQREVTPYGKAHYSLHLENVLDDPWCWGDVPDTAMIIEDQAVAYMGGVTGIDGSLIECASVQDCPPNLDKLMEVVWNDLLCKGAIFGHRNRISVD